LFGHFFHELNKTVKVDLEAKREVVGEHENSIILKICFLRKEGYDMKEVLFSGLKVFRK